MSYLYPPASGGIIARVRANNTSAQALLPATAFANWVNWTEQEDLNNNFAAATGVFTAPSTGTYFITIDCGMNLGATAGPYLLDIAINGVQLNENPVAWTHGNVLSWNIRLVAADTLTFPIAGSGNVSATAKYNNLTIIGLG